MSIKQILLQEAQNIDTSVELDSIFESIELSEDVKVKFGAAFETAVKAKAVELAESHIRDIAEQADALVEEAAQEKFEQLSEQANRYFDHITEHWMAENKLAVENGIKVQMFDSLMGTLKEAFLEHHVEVPTDAINIVEELEEELQEHTLEINKLLGEKAELQSKLDSNDRQRILDEAVAGLSDVQKDKVMSLTEGLTYGANFGTKVQAIVEMVNIPLVAKRDEQIAEQANPNYEGDPVVEEAKPAPTRAAQNSVNRYLDF